MEISCIGHIPKTQLVILHWDYIQICDGDSAAAILLKIYEYWTDVKINDLNQRKRENKARQREGLELISEDLWIYKTHDDLVSDSLGLLKLHDVRRGLPILDSKGFISRRQNPNFRWDRTPQYLLNYQRVQSTLDALKYSIVTGDRSSRHLSQVDDLPVASRLATGNGTIPKITSEITTSSSPTPPVKKTEEEEKVEVQLPPPFSTLSPSHLQEAIKLCKLNNLFLREQCEALKDLVKGNPGHYLLKVLRNGGIAGAGEIAAKAREREQAMEEQRREEKVRAKAEEEAREQVELETKELDGYFVGLPVEEQEKIRAEAIARIPAVARGGKYAVNWEIREVLRERSRNAA